MGLIVEQFITADGYAADEHGGLDFITGGDTYSELDDTQLEFLSQVDAILLGANTYRLFADYWPNADPAVEPVAEPIARLPKFVVSTTLPRAPWGDGEAQILAGDPADTVAALKRHYRGIVVWGSLRLTDALFRAGLVDRLRLRVVPTLIGGGRSFTDADLGTIRLQLRHSTTHPSGQIVVEYQLT